MESLQQVKITDFGLAKLVTGNHDLSTSDAVSSTLKVSGWWWDGGNGGVVEWWDSGVVGWLGGEMME